MLKFPRPPPLRLGTVHINADGLLGIAATPAPSKQRFAIDDVLYHVSIDPVGDDVVAMADLTAGICVFAVLTFLDSLLAGIRFIRSRPDILGAALVLAA